MYVDHLYSYIYYLVLYVIIIIFFDSLKSNKLILKSLSYECFMAPNEYFSFLRVYINECPCTFASPTHLDAVLPVTTKQQR